MRRKPSGRTSSTREYFQGAATFYRHFNLLLALDYERRQAEALQAHRAGNPRRNNMQFLTDFADQLQAWAAEIHARALHYQGTQTQRLYNRVSFYPAPQRPSVLLAAVSLSPALIWIPFSTNRKHGSLFAMPKFASAFLQLLVCGVRTEILAVYPARKLYTRPSHQRDFLRPETSRHYLV
jgi:hypothetical protein